MKARGTFFYEHRRSGRLLQRRRIPNQVMLQGLTALLTDVAQGGTPNIRHSIGLIDDVGFSEVDVTDTASSHPGWQEFTSYAEAVRGLVTASMDIPASQIFLSATTFTITAEGEVRGFFVATSAVKGATTGTLWAARDLDEPLNVVPDDTIFVFYQFIVELPE